MGRWLICGWLSATKSQDRTHPFLLQFGQQGNISPDTHSLVYTLIPGESVKYEICLLKIIYFIQKSIKGLVISYRIGLSMNMLYSTAN